MFQPHPQATALPYFHRLLPVRHHQRHQARHHRCLRALNLAPNLQLQHLISRQAFHRTCHRFCHRLHQLSPHVLKWTKQPTRVGTPSKFLSTLTTLPRTPSRTTGLVSTRAKLRNTFIPKFGSGLAVRLQEAARLQLSPEMLSSIAFHLTTPSTQFTYGQLLHSLGRMAVSTAVSRLFC